MVVSLNLTVIASDLVHCIYEYVCNNLCWCFWSWQMTFDFLAMHLFGYDAKKLPETKRISDDMFPKFLGRLLCFPLNIPGTTYHKCLQVINYKYQEKNVSWWPKILELNQRKWHEALLMFIQQGKKAFSIMKNIMEERPNFPEKYYGDFMGEAISYMETQKILTDDQIVYILLGIMFATFESFSSTITLIFQLLSENPSVSGPHQLKSEYIIFFMHPFACTVKTLNDYLTLRVRPNTKRFSRAETIQVSHHWRGKNTNHWLLPNMWSQNLTPHPYSFLKIN